MNKYLEGGLCVFPMPVQTPDGCLDWLTFHFCLECPREVKALV